MDDPMPIFDYTAGTPWVQSPELTTRMMEAQEQGEPVAEAWSRTDVELLRNNERYGNRFRARFEKAGVDVISVTLGSRVEPARPYPDRVRRDLARWQARFDSLDWLRKVTGPEEAMAVAASGDVGIVLNTQNLGRAIDGDLSRIKELYDAGVLVMQLTYNRQNLLGTGCTDYSNGGTIGIRPGCARRNRAAWSHP